MIRFTQIECTGVTEAGPQFRELGGISINPLHIVSVEPWGRNTRIKFSCGHVSGEPTVKGEYQEIADQVDAHLGRRAS